jgi:hypothetical protein
VESEAIEADRTEPSGAFAPTSVNGAADVPNDDEDEEDAQRLRAAKNVFNAVEMKPPEA